jgi:hypothetical protein
MTPDPRDVIAIELPWLGLTLQVHAVTIRRPSRAAAVFVATFARADERAGTKR